jgi:hypothetical protein
MLARVEAESEMAVPAIHKVRIEIAVTTDGETQEKAYESARSEAVAKMACFHRGGFCKTEERLFDLGRYPGFNRVQVRQTWELVTV